MIFNSLYKINISLVGIIHQIMYLIYQINLDLISVRDRKFWCSQSKEKDIGTSLFGVDVKSLLIFYYQKIKK